MTIHARRRSHAATGMEILPTRFLPFGTYSECNGSAPADREIVVIRRLLDRHRASAPPPSPLPDPAHLAVAVYHDSPALLSLLPPFLVLANHAHSEVDMAAMLMRSVLPPHPPLTLLPNTPLAHLVASLYFDQQHSLATLRVALRRATGLAVLPARVVEECLLAQAASRPIPTSLPPTLEPLSELHELVVALYLDAELGLPALAQMLDRVGVCVAWAAALIARACPAAAAATLAAPRWRPGGVPARCACAACAALRADGLLGAWVEAGLDAPGLWGDAALRRECAAARRRAERRARPARWGLGRARRRPSVQMGAVLWEFDEEEGAEVAEWVAQGEHHAPPGPWVVGDASDSEDEDGFTRVGWSPSLPASAVAQIEHQVKR